MNKDYIFIQKKTHAHFFPNIYVIGKIYSFTMKKLFAGYTFGPTLALIKNGEMFWYASEQGLKDVSTKSFEMVKNDPLMVKKIRSKFKSLAPKMLKLTSGFTISKLKKLNNIQLSILMDKYLTNYENIYLWGEPVVLSLNDLLDAYLKEYLSTLVEDKKQVTGYFNILISPLEKSFVKQEEDVLLNIALKIKQGKIKDLDKAVKKHTQNYCWVPYDYGVYLWNEKYFKTVLEKMLLDREIEKDLQKSKKYFSELYNKQKTIIKKIKIDKYHSQLFSAMRDAAYILDYKKEVFTQAHYHLINLFNEISVRLSINELYLHYCTPKEMQNALKGITKLDENLLKERYQLSLSFWNEDQIEIKSGSEGEIFLNQFLKKQTEAETFLNGVIASAGKYTGTVKALYNSKDMDKVNDGDILVAAMTNPDLVPAMRRAGAIITDEGGVMCHAAIVSRELGIPCVVGTKNATKLLKDGEIVEVNANHNSVKILKK